MVVLLETDRSAGERKIRLGPLLRPIATNPLILSTILGLAWSLCGFGMPKPLDTFLSVLGDALTPCALFAIGLELTLGDLRERLSFYAVLTLVKLLLVPLVVYLFCLGIGLDGTAMVAAVVCAAVPTGKTGYILAVEYGTEKAMMGAVISLSTLFSIFSMLGWLYVLRGV